NNSIAPPCPTIAPAAIAPPPATKPGPFKRSGAAASTTIRQPDAFGNVPMIRVRVGTQVQTLLMDTGSSWMILNKTAVAGNPQLGVTGETATVVYSSGGVCLTGQVASAPVSIGGLKPKRIKFLLVDNGNLGFAGIIGLNTWDPQGQGKLPIPMRALGISK